jgi:hypothetical protein
MQEDASLLQLMAINDRGNPHEDEEVNDDHAEHGSY